MVEVVLEAIALKEHLNREPQHDLKVDLLCQAWHRNFVQVLCIIIPSEMRKGKLFRNIN